ncbi:MAG: hypothetical protein WBN29_09080, partial [Polyangiales bacterium]
LHQIIHVLSFSSEVAMMRALRGGDNGANFAGNFQSMGQILSKTPCTAGQQIRMLRPQSLEKGSP